MQLPTTAPPSAIFSGPEYLKTVIDLTPCQDLPLGSGYCGSLAVGGETALKLRKMNAAAPLKKYR